MAETIYADDTLITKRFPCDCMWHKHILEVEIEKLPDGLVSLCAFNFYMDGRAPLRFRLKQIWNLMRGRDGELCDFLLRKQDAGELINTLSCLVTNPNTE